MLCVNMDTGYVTLLNAAIRRRVMNETLSEMRGEMFVAGAFVADTPGASFNLDAYRMEIDLIQKCAAIPVIFQCYGLSSLPPDKLLNAYRALARDCPRFIAFELSTQFAPFGRIYDLETYAGLLDIPQCIG